MGGNFSISPPEKYNALINARLPSMDIDFGINVFWDFGENMKIRVWGQNAGFLISRDEFQKRQKCVRDTLFQHSRPATLGISAERSKFRPDVRNFGRTFGISVGRSKFWPDVLKNEAKKISLGTKNGLPVIFVEAKLIF